MIWVFMELLRAIRRGFGADERTPVVIGEGEENFNNQEVCSEGNRIQFDKAR